MNGSALSLTSVSRSFGALEVMRNLTLDVAAGEFVALVGPSGCGKSTLLNILAGHDVPTAGSVSRTTTLRMVYQQDGLFPWLTCGENVELGLAHRTANGVARGSTESWLDSVGLAEFQDAYPHQLSGGMRQRIELVRALCAETGALLLDEPFSSLDYITRLRMRDELARLLTTSPRTIVLVTHDIEEAAQLADRVLVLSDRPARVLHEHVMTEARPRTPTDVAVVDAVRVILDVMGLTRSDAAGAPAKL